MKVGDLVVRHPYPRYGPPAAGRAAHVVARINPTDDEGGSIVITACGRRFEGYILEVERPDTRRPVCGACGARWDEVDPD